MQKLAIIGVTGYGAIHYTNLQELTEAGLATPVAATVINPDEVPEKCAWLREQGCRIYKDYKEMLRDFAGQIDLCLIPTGIHMHAPMSIAAMRAGANVLVEKPAAALLPEIRAMQACESETGRFVAVGYQSIYAPCTMALKTRLCNGEFGKAEVFKCRGLWPRMDNYYSRNGWAGKLQVNDVWVMDSPFNNALAHYINLMLFLAGPTPRLSVSPTSITAELYRARPIETTDTACMRISTAGPDVLFYVTHCPAESFGPEIVVRCEKATITWTSTETRIAWTDGRVETLPTTHGDDLRRCPPRAALERCSDPTAFICDLGIAGTQTICANGAHDSSPIATLPKQYVRRVASGDSVASIIEGLDALIDRAFTSEKLFSELGVAWSVPGKPVSLKGYQGYGAALKQAKAKS